MKTALVVSGGGSRGAFAVGAIETLWERGWRFDVISGTSTGALIASLVSIGDIETLVELYTNVRTKDIVRLNWRRLFRNAIYDTKPLERLIRRTMRGERYERLMAGAVTTLLCCVGFQTGRIIYGSQRSIEGHSNVVPWGDFDGFVRASLASTNEPTLMPPMWVAGEPCLDGGVREVVPFQIVEALGADRVVVVVNSPVEPEIAPCLSTNLLGIGARAIDLMTTEICNNDIRTHTGAEVIVIRPISSLPGDSLKFIPSEMQVLREIGQTRAKTVLLQK